MSYHMEHQSGMKHYHALLNEAEKYQLARQALEGRPKNQKIWCKGLSWFGSRLSAWGNHLQERYGFAVQVTTSVSGHSG
jgi:hypothetical protein